MEELQEGMTARQLACKEQRDTFGDDISIVEICMWLRQQVNGSITPWPQRRVDTTLALLKSRIKTWVTGNLRQSRFDNAVYELIQATIKEVESYS